MKKDGFTMIEILVAMVVLAIGLLGMAGMTIIVMRGNRGAVNLTAASNVCQKKIEELKDLKWGEVGSSPVSEAENAIFLGASNADMVQEGSVDAGQGLNSQGLTKQGFYEQENSVAGSDCHGQQASNANWEDATLACQDYIREAGPYKFARTFVICKGSDYDESTGAPPSGSEAQATNAVGHYRAEIEPDCRVNPSQNSTRTPAVACYDTDITTDPGTGNKEKKIKALCAWRDSNGSCHSIHMETTIVDF